MSARVIHVRPSRSPRRQKQGGWEVYEAEGVQPVYCGPNAREDALSYARQRAGYAPTEIRVLDVEWNLTETIPPENVRGLIQFLLAFPMHAGYGDKAWNPRSPPPDQTAWQCWRTKNDNKDDHRDSAILRGLAAF